MYVLHPAVLSCSGQLGGYSGGTHEFPDIKVFILKTHTCQTEMTTMTMVKVGNRRERVRPRSGKVLLLLLFHRSKEAACWCGS